jgi:hypothetical protein
MCHNVHVAFGIFPLPWAATLQTLGCLLHTSPPEVDWADLPLIGHGLLRRRDEPQEAPHVRGLGLLDELGPVALGQ